MATEVVDSFTEARRAYRDIMARIQVVRATVEAEVAAGKTDRERERLNGKLDGVTLALDAARVVIQEVPIAEVIPGE
jgi:hypothetical protein